MNKKITKAGVNKKEPKDIEFTTIDTEQNKFEKKSVEAIQNESNEIDVSKISKEILSWVTTNVEQFIDNQKKAFKLDFIVDSETMPETSKLQSLYRAIPYVESCDNSLSDSEKKIKETEANECREGLDSITKSIHLKMKEDKEALENLFKRMGFYYEMKGFYNGKPLVKNLIGAVDIANFEYENFSMGVKINAPAFKIAKQDGEQTLINGQEKEYVIPEGFSVWIEIAFQDSYSQKSMF
jgi:hypothetical protein